MSDMEASFILFVLVDMSLVWAAGFVFAIEDVIGGTRHRLENWAYHSPDLVRGGDDTMDLQWDRWAGWLPFRKHPGRWQNLPLVFDDVNFTGLGPRRGRVPVRLSTGMVGYALPRVMLDGEPRALRFMDQWAIRLRGKAADWWGCPHCSSFLGSIPAAFVVNHFAGFHVAVIGVVAAHLAAWGAARRIGWGTH